MHVFLPLPEDFKHFKHQLNYMYKSATILSLRAEGSKPQWAGEEWNPAHPESGVPSTKGFSLTSLNWSHILALQESQLKSM